MTIKLLTAIAALVWAAIAGATEPEQSTLYKWEVVRIIDGDTVEVNALWLPPELGKTISIRLHGVDAPESSWRAQCDAERTQGRLATAALARLLVPRAEVKVVGWDKYGSRILGDFVVDGKSVRDTLLEQGHVQLYLGAGPKPNWCQ